MKVVANGVWLIPMVLEPLSVGNWMLGQYGEGHEAWLFPEPNKSGGDDEEGGKTFEDLFEGVRVRR